VTDALPGHALADLAEGAREAGRLAVDTEFMGEGRYRTLLCLIQLAIPDSPDTGERIALVDPLPEGLDLGPLAAVLADPRIEVVVHAGRQDIALLRRRLRTEVRNVFDTQIAAGFAGMGAQSSYHTLLAEILGLRVGKTASFTRWDARPLSPEQVAYAREDVVHLLELADELQRRLLESGRLAWAREECEPLEQASDERDLDSVFERLPRVGGLGAGTRPIARELVRWREQTAQRHDRPVQSILGDAVLMELARRAPGSREQLARIRGIGGAGGRRGEELLDAIRRGKSQPPDPAPPRPRAPQPKPDDAPLIALSEALLRARAREAGLAYELLATRADLQAIVAGVRGGGADAGAVADGGSSGVRTLGGWRRELVGEELLELLAGGVSLSVRVDGQGRRVVVDEAG
jgi:ribonuclease D